MHIVLTGATGSIGTEVLRQCLKSLAITHITVLGRRPPTSFAAASNLTFITHTDFLTYPLPLLASLCAKGCKACIWCLGVHTTQARDRTEYELITRDYPLAAAKAFKSLCSNFRFIYTSILGADVRAWERVRAAHGQAERELLGLEGVDVFCVRPGAVEAAKKEGAGWWERFGALVTLLFRAVPSLHIHGDILASGYVKIAVEGMEGVKEVLGEEKRVIPSKEMKLLAAADPGRNNKAGGL